MLSYNFMHFNILLNNALHYVFPFARFLPSWRCTEGIQYHISVLVKQRIQMPFWSTYLDPEDRMGTNRALVILTSIDTSSGRRFWADTFFLSLRSTLSGRLLSVSFSRLVPIILWRKEKVELSPQELKRIQQWSLSGALLRWRHKNPPNCFTISKS